jgi:hypothetical protein
MPWRLRDGRTWRLSRSVPHLGSSLPNAQAKPMISGPAAGSAASSSATMAYWPGFGFRNRSSQCRRRFEKISPWRYFSESKPRYAVRQLSVCNDAMSAESEGWATRIFTAMLSRDHKFRRTSSAMNSDKPARSGTRANLGRLTRASFNPGLCADCIHAQQVMSARESNFLLCRLSFSDSKFPKYPRLPVLSCSGYEPAPQANS